MTELDWQMTGTRPLEMLRQVLKRLGSRRAQLLSCALCRLMGEKLLPEWRDAITSAERFADGSALKPEFLAARVLESDPSEPDDSSVRASRIAVQCALHSDVSRGLQGTVAWVRVALRDPPHIPDDAGDALVCDLFREIAGNPFRPWMRNPDFLGGGLTTPAGRTVPFTADVRNLARSIALAQDFDRLPILADAAEEMGLDDAELLTHLRRPGGHVRGCWALDLLDGKG